jgi:hypothetical protein
VDVAAKTKLFVVVLYKLLIPEKSPVKDFNFSGLFFCK